jgi:hypothetical protein
MYPVDGISTSVWAGPQEPRDWRGADVQSAIRSHWNPHSWELVSRPKFEPGSSRSVTSWANLWNLKKIHISVEIVGTIRAVCSCWMNYNVHSSTWMKLNKLMRNFWGFPGRRHGSCFTVCMLVVLANLRNTVAAVISKKQKAMIRRVKRGEACKGCESLSSGGHGSSCAASDGPKEMHTHFSRSYLRIFSECIVIFSQKMVLVIWMPEPPYRWQDIQRKCRRNRVYTLFAAPFYNRDVPASNPGWESEYPDSGSVVFLRSSGKIPR